MGPTYLLLVVLVTFLALYDWQMERLPNKVTILLLTGGLFLNWPGAPPIWLGSLLLFSTWQIGGIGGGDAKLWMALLWLTPRALATPALLVFGLVLTLTALAQFLWRSMHSQPSFGTQSPGAWRTVPYVLWLLFAV